MNKILNSVKNQKKLLSFMALSYLDRAIIFLLPLLVLEFFKDQQEYVSVEYIYSATTVLIPLIDLGISGYFYYAYRNSENQKETLKAFTVTFQKLYVLISVLSLFLIALNYFSYEFEKFLIFILSRLLFVLATTFFASYFRLINKPQNAVYITLLANVLSLAFILFFFLYGAEFSLWLLFIGQIVFTVGYLFKCVIDLFIKNKKLLKSVSGSSIVKKALLFSWPSIIQTFIMMYIANYGKLQMDNLSLDDGTLLSFTQRFSMLIQLTHVSVLAFLMKEIYVAKDVLAINKKVLIKYLALLLAATFCVIILISSYILYIDLEYEVNQLVLLVGCIVAYTFLWCISSYFEVYFSRENKNELKLILAVVNAAVFIGVFLILKESFLNRIAIAMFASVFVSFLCNIFILKRRNYKIL